ncbi:MAG: SHOCT domain-containing protein [Planctomycetota bacterium]
MISIAHLSSLTLSTTNSATRSSLGDVIITLGVLLALLLIGVAVSVIVRRRMLSDDTGDSVGFTLQELREMKASGKISDEEYEAARAAMIGRVKAEPRPADEAVPETRE